jgi:hypothetical protein
MMVKQRWLIKKRIKNIRTTDIVRLCYVWIKKNHIKKTRRKEFIYILAKQTLKEVIQNLNLLRKTSNN